nr:MAG: NUDIX family hydrolase [Diabrotica toursvirus 3a]
MHVNNSDILLCSSKCCVLKKTATIKREPEEFIKNKINEIRSALLIIDSSDRILITQSYNKFWGIPKGCKNINETFIDAVIRETKEETGYAFNKESFLSAIDTIFTIGIKDNVNVVFFIRLNYKLEEINCTPDELHSESTGFGWINIDCLKSMIFNKNLKVNYVTIAGTWC